MTPIPRARLFGHLVQGTVLGVLAFGALVQMAMTAGGAAIFLYQGF